MNVQETWKKNWPWMVGIAGAVLVAVLYLLFAGLNTPEARARRAISLGERYLLEENYDQAVLQFTDAIDIIRSEPSIVYLEAQAVTGLNQAAVGGAVAQVQAPGGDLQDAVTWLQANQCDTLEATRIFGDGLSLLEQLRDLCAAENYEEVFSLLADEGYKDTVAQLMALDCALRLFDDQTDLLTAIYRMEVDTRNFTDADTAAQPVVATAETAETAQPAVVDTSYMVYYGAHDGDIRSGEGVWLAYQDGNNYLARGTWANDRPNGAFETRSWQTNLNTTVTYRVIEGNVVDGLWDGTVTWRFERGEATDEYAPAFSAGIWQILRQEDGLSIAADNGDGNRLVVTEPDKTNGIAGYAEVA